MIRTWITHLVACAVATVVCLGTYGSPSALGQESGSSQSDDGTSVDLHAISLVDKIRWAAQAIVAPELLEKIMIVYVYHDVSTLDGLPSCSSLQQAEATMEPCILGYVENPSNKAEQGVALRLQMQQAESVRKDAFIGLNTRIGGANRDYMSYWTNVPIQWHQSDNEQRELQEIEPK